MQPKGSPGPSVSGSASSSVPQGRPVNRSARSREGCLTCKRRKVKCDEQRPRCSHCERLNMECKWQPASAATAGARRRSVVSAGAAGRPPKPHSPSMTDPSPHANTALPQSAVNQIFDYASFLWDGSDAWQQVSPEIGQSLPIDDQFLQYGPFGQQTPVATETPLLTGPASIALPDKLTLPEQSEPSTVPDTSSQLDPAQALQVSEENHRLMDYFIHAVIPPILAEVETKKKWFSMRQALVTMASSSRMVRWAILAFSSLMLCQREGPWVASQQNHYDDAMAEVQASNFDAAHLTQHSKQRENLLATLFFLSYVDILEGRIEAAHANLKRAYGIFHQGKKGSFTSIERQLLLWIRLLDARAVSAGGDGLFLSKDDELVLVETPPATLGTEVSDASKDADGDIEDVLFQVLYHPGIVFFQKVQSFMGHICQLDPWHRSRGTVEDELEVMNIGVTIAQDLRDLYDQRPILMDYAVVGKLTAPHVSAHLAFAITRAFRTYLSNYYASKVHLHRIAYKSLPLTQEASDALDQIRSLAKLMTEGLDGDEALPVNMLWPLMMLGTEEQDPDERVWIKTQILRMQRVAGNARITAQVLDEVQARQDAGKARVDIRLVMHAIFNSCFAVV